MYDQLGYGNSYPDGHSEQWTQDAMGAIEKALNE